MTDIYKPRTKGTRIPMPLGQPDWPEDGRPVDFTNPYESRLVKDGDLVKVPDTAEQAPSRGKK